MRFRALRMNHRLFVLNLLPLERLLSSVRIEALAILPRGREQAPGHLGAHVGIPKLECRGFDGERAAVLWNECLVDAARAMTHDMLGVLAQQGKAGTHAVRGVVHRREAFPVAWPSVHVLLMTSAEELNAAQL